MSLVIILIREILSAMHDIFVSVLCIQELGLINVDKDAVISSDKGLSEVTHFNLITMGRDVFPVSNLNKIHPGDFMMSISLCISYHLYFKTQ